MPSRIVRGVFTTLLLGCLTCAVMLPTRASAQAAQQVAEPASAAETLSAAPYLRTILPADALAYLRLPNLWGLLAEPKGTVFDSALKNESVRQALQALRGGLWQNWLEPLQGQLGPLPGLVLNQLRSPLEAALLPPSAGADQTMPALPAVLITAQLSSTTVAEVNDLLRKLAEQAGAVIQLAGELDQAGQGYLQIMGLPVQVHFDSGAQRLFALLSQDPADALGARLAAKPSAAASPAAALEQTIDASGQGLYFWLDVKTASALAMPMLPPEQQLSLQMLGANQIDALALGLGVSEGKGRLQLVVEMPHAGMRALLPAVNAELDLASAGAPQFVVMLGLPTAADWARAEAFLRLTVPDWDAQWPAIQEKIVAATGFSLEQWLNLFGPEWVYVDDQAGQYAALRLRDADKFQQLLILLQERHNFGYETRELDGHTYAHLTIPDFVSDPASPPGERLLQRLLGGVPAHLYWKREGDYLIHASLPQVLRDRDRLGARTPVGAWLRDTQKVISQDALLLASAQAEDLPQMLYLLNLQALLGLSDIAGQKLDLFTLPSPLELNLPPRGSYSFKLGSSERRLGLELVYESNPLEFMLTGGSMTTAVVAGLVAAIAIPAYQDYQVRSVVSVQLNQAQIVKLVLSEFYASQGRFPSDQELDQVLDQVTYIDLDAEIEPDTGVITLYIESETLTDGNRVFLTPRDEGGGTLEWVCEAELAEKYLPADCR